jgi:signal transduction histidine kinase/CheY-like chemotaxis protein
VRRWFERLPIRRKLVVFALTITASALTAAILGLTMFDVARFRTNANDETRAVAQLLAQNTAAAIVFNDDTAAAQTLNAVSLRPMISLACLYRADGTIVASFQRPGLRCPDAPNESKTWRAVAASAPVSRNGLLVGTVLVERQLSDLMSRLVVTLAMGGVVLLLAGGVAFALATRLQRVISRPIVELAAAASDVGRTDHFDMPAIDAPPDESGELVQAFDAMVRRLLLSNEALRAEVDERRRMQAERETLLTREREASRLKDEFLAAVSHELRTPLNAILGWTHILATTQPSDEVLAKAIASLSRSAQAQNRVIQDLLDISRIITGKFELTPAVIDLRSTLESTVEGFALTAQTKGVEVITEWPPGPCEIYADHDRIRQVLQNLLSNAIKFTPRGGVVTVQLVCDSAAFRIVVSDNGIGISDRFLPYVFERFRQADGSTTRGYGGLGLGLSIVKELTEQHGGSVTAASAGPGLGSSFTVTLPRFAGVPGEVRRIRDDGPAPRLDGVSVLVIDDHPDALEVLSRMLIDAGATVHPATSGLAGLDCLRRTMVKVVLCDLAMPEMDGFEALRRIRLLDRETGRDTSVFAVSAFASSEDRARCLAAGFTGHIAKPFSARDLARIVAGAAGRSDTRADGMSASESRT